MNLQTRPAFRKPPWKQLWKGTAEGPYVCPDPVPTCPRHAPWGRRGRQCTPLIRARPRKALPGPFTSVTYGHAPSCSP